MEDRYKSFEELSKHENEGRGRDFEIEYQPKGSMVLVMAPHGGAIEPYTASLARMIAGDDFSCYTFRGIKKRGNRDLHITSHRFDEPKALAAADSADIVVAIHGANNDEEAFVMVGGRHRSLCHKIEKRLTKAGFYVKPPGPGMNATHPHNICNRGRSGKGVQLELSTRIRKAFKLDNEKRQSFVDVVREVLLGEEKTRPLHNAPLRPISAHAPWNAKPIPMGSGGTSRRRGSNFNPAVAGSPSPSRYLRASGLVLQKISRLWMDTT